VPDTVGSFIIFISVLSSVCCDAGPPAPPPSGQVVGEFHTHPNWHPPDGKDEAGKEWKQGPSDPDKNAKTPGTTGIVQDRAGTTLY
jgi:hypothetical protein